VLAEVECVLHVIQQWHDSLSFVNKSLCFRRSSLMHDTAVLAHKDKELKTTDHALGTHNVRSISFLFTIPWDCTQAVDKGAAHYLHSSCRKKARTRTAEL